jgi:hypothetical protein
VPWLGVRSDEECQGFGDGGRTIQEGGDEFLVDSQCDFLAEGAEDIQPSDEIRDLLSSATAVIRTRRQDCARTVRGCWDRVQSW